MTHRRRLAAWAFAIAVHLVLTSLLLSVAPGSINAQGGDELAGFTVTMVAASSLKSTSASPSQAGGLQPLLAKFNADQPPVAIDPQRSDVSRMLRRLEDSARAEPSPRHEEFEPARVSRSQVRTAVDAADTADQSGGKAGNPAGLIGLMAPCWRRFEIASGLPVTLDVTLDFQGRIAKPPTIVRTAGVPVDEPRLRSEARALSALLACMPNNGFRFGGQTYRLEFRPAGSMG